MGAYIPLAFIYSLGFEVKVKNPDHREMALGGPFQLGGLGTGGPS